MRRARFGAVSLIFAALSACEPTPATAPPQPKPVEIATPPEATATAAPGPELSPVAEPADIVAIGRWRSPITTVSNLAACAGVAPIIVEVNARMGISFLLREFLRGDTRKLAGLVALDAPIDVVASLDPDERPRPPRYALSIGLSSLDGAKVAFDDEAKGGEVAPGVWKVKGTRGVACGVAASAGATPARFICADKEKTLIALAPYMARNVPGLDLGGPDMHVEGRLAVLEKRYGTSLRNLLRVLPNSFATEYGIGDQRFDHLLFESGVAVQEDAGKLLADVQRITAEVKTERSGACLRATADVDLSGKTSWLAQTLTDRLDRAGPPPAIYWRLPKDSEAALYSRGVDNKRFTAVITRLRELFDAALAQEGFAAADRKKVVEIIDLPYDKDTTFVLSHGSVSAPLPPAGSKDEEKKIIEASIARLGGWTLMGVDQAPDAMKKHLKTWLDAYKLAGVQSGLKKLAGSDAKHLPVVKAGTVPPGFAAGTEAYEITVPNFEVPKKDGSRKETMALKLHLLFMPDGDSSWIAFGAVKDELVKRLAAVKSGAPDKEQLATRSGLDSLRNGKQMLGGYLSAAPVSQKILSIMLGDAAINGSMGQNDQAIARALESLPNGGKTPIFITGNGTAGTPAKLSLALEVQQGTFEDTKSLIISTYSVLSRMGIVP